MAQSTRPEGAFEPPPRARNPSRGGHVSVLPTTGQIYSGAICAIFQ